MVLGIFGLIRFFSDASEFAAQECQANSRLDATIHKRIVKVGKTLGGIGAVFGVCAAVAGLWVGPKDPRQALGLILFPLVFAAIGLVGGMSMVCSFAPSSFFQSQSGQRLLVFIGTEKALVARIACATVLLLILAFLSVLIALGVVAISRAR